MNISDLPENEAAVLAALKALYGFFVTERDDPFAFELCHSNVVSAQWGEVHEFLTEDVPVPDPTTPAETAAIEAVRKCCEIQQTLPEDVRHSLNDEYKSAQKFLRETPDAFPTDEQRERYNVGPFFPFQKNQ